MHQHVGTTPSADEKKKLDADMFGVDTSNMKTKKKCFACTNMLAPHLPQMKKKVGHRHVWCGHLQHENKKKMFCMHQHVGTTPSTDEKKSWTPTCLVWTPQLKNKIFFLLHQHMLAPHLPQMKKKLDADMFGVDPSTEK